MNKIFAIDKWYGISSNDAIQYLKYHLKLNKIGHAGTLDPLATGVLVCACDDKTKDISELVNDQKQYIAHIKFGLQTDTYDCSGKIVNRCDKEIKLEDIIKVIDNSLLEYEQLPPKYSAVKVNGKKLYEYARSEQDVEIKTRKAIIHDYKIICYSNNMLVISMTVNKGFYVRSFANDIGLLLNTYSYLYDLRRTKSGSFDIEHAYQMTDLYKFTNSATLIEGIKEKITINNLVIGQFDLIHKGHLKLFQEKEFDVLTFVSNPNKTKEFYKNDERISHLKKVGANHIYLYDIENNNLDALSFIELLKSKFNINKVIVGSDFMFGKDRTGNVDLLKQHFNVQVIENDQQYSGTKVRELIKLGEIEKANEMLFEDVHFNYIVCHGRKNGRMLGFPTANTYFKTNLEIKQGSYASKVIYRHQEYNAATFIRKIRPDIYLMESNIFDFNHELYGKEIKIILKKFIRETSIPKSEEMLAEMIKSDTEKIKEFLSK